MRLLEDISQMWLVLKNEYVLEVGQHRVALCDKG